MDKIPIIDLSLISGKYETIRNRSEIFNKISEEFGKAMSSIGFAYIKNHGIDVTLVNEVQRISNFFFALPADVKTKYKKLDPTTSFHGYGGFGDEVHHSEVSIELHEFFDFWGPMQYSNKGFPIEVFGWKKSFDDLRPHCDNLCKKLFRCMAQYLELTDEEFFNNNHSFMSDSSIQTHTQFRVVNYPKMEVGVNELSEGTTRLGEHSDWGTITLLFQDQVGGLDVKTADGNWLPAVPIKDTIIVNGGQLMEIWSGAIYPATIHRVRLLDKTRHENRQSLIYFVAPNADVTVKTIKCLKKYATSKSTASYDDSVNSWDYYFNRIKTSVQGYQ